MPLLLVGEVATQYAMLLVAGARVIHVGTIELFKPVILGCMTPSLFSHTGKKGKIILRVELAPHLIILETRKEIDNLFSISSSVVITDEMNLFLGQTGVALGIEVDDRMPQHEYIEYFGPEYTLHVAPSNMENKNSRELLEQIRLRLLDNLSKLQHAPSVQFQERPPDTQFLEADEDEDNKDERNHPDSDVNVDCERKPTPRRVKMEFVESEPNHKNHEAVDQLAREVESTLIDTKSSKDSIVAAEAAGLPYVKAEQSPENADDEVGPSGMAQQ
ncbi:UNVERIFIED_CONTAM: Histone deacetylase 19 [Sesamum radiatum]|uniref:Histone deacetylase 19 n=1 Tax=Sesamum radiatum TaxID=300843 RepID=A0AAW2RDV2_SESRA